jgi:hypothetical protein
MIAGRAEHSKNKNVFELPLAVGRRSAPGSQAAAQPDMAGDGFRLRRGRTHPGWEPRLDSPKPPDDSNTLASADLTTPNESAMRLSRARGQGAGRFRPDGS